MHVKYSEKESMIVKAIFTRHSSIYMIKLLSNSGSIPSNGFSLVGLRSNENPGSSFPTPGLYPGETTSHSVNSLSKLETSAS